MRKKTTKAAGSKSVSVVAEKSLSTSVALAGKGIQTIGDFAGVMGALVTDVLVGSVEPRVANAAINAGGKMMKAVELQLKYGPKSSNGTVKQLKIA